MCRRIFIDKFIADLLSSLILKELWKLVAVWRSYRQEHSNQATAVTHSCLTVGYGLFFFSFLCHLVWAHTQCSKMQCCNKKSFACWSAVKCCEQTKQETDSSGCFTRLSAIPEVLISTQYAGPDRTTFEACSLGPPVSGPNQDFPRWKVSDRKLFHVFADFWPVEVTLEIKCIRLVLNLVPATKFFQHYT